MLNVLHYTGPTRQFHVGPTLQEVIQSYTTKTNHQNSNLLKIETWLNYFMLDSEYRKKVSPTDAVPSPLGEQQLIPMYSD
jgi:hypothetical protein